MSTTPSAFRSAARSLGCPPRHDEPQIGVIHYPIPVGIPWDWDLEFKGPDVAFHDLGSGIST